MARPQPGRTEALHRLNRTEYQNAMRDLLALDIDAAALMPADDQSYGFDNIAGVLKMSPTLLERYMGAAREISRLAVGVAKIPPTAETFRLRSDLSQYEHIDGLPFGTRGGTAVRYTFPQDGEYMIKVEMLDLFSGAQIKEPHHLEISVDGRQVQLFKLGESKKMGQDPNDPTRTSTPSQDALQVRVPVRAGPHVVTTTFVKKTEALAEIGAQAVRQAARRRGLPALPAAHRHGDDQRSVQWVARTGHAEPPTHLRLPPGNPAEEAGCAKQIVSTLARRAYRRPVTDARRAAAARLLCDARASSGFDAGIERAMQALLVSPSFLYRVERDPSSAQGRRTA